MLLTNSIAYTIPQRRSQAFVAVQIVLSSLFIALCAQISIPLPFTPVPVTMQTLAVMMVGVMLGSRKGAISVLLYLAESVFGLPVLAGGQVNTLALIGLKGGYYFGFIAQAYLAGWFAERRGMLGKSLTTMGISLACAVQLAVGGLWLAQFIGYEAAFMLGVLPFIFGEALKVLIVANFLSRHDNTTRL
jgi:biotin transport system substrate-specific component